MASILTRSASRVVSTAPQSTIFTVQSRNMATEQQLKSRLRSVANIGKITKAMKMVAASKLRRVERLLKGARTFQTPMNAIWSEAEKSDEVRPQKELIVALSSDRGLCGGVNSAITKAVRARIQGNDKENRTSALILLGEKSKAALDRLYGDRIRFAISDVGKSRPVNFNEVSLITEYILSEQYDAISFVFNKFKSAIAYDTSFVRTLALQPAAEDKDWDNYNFEGDKRDVLQNLYEFRIAVRLYHMFVEAATSEQSARMAAMDNSSKNAGEMLFSLRLLYNRRRQAKITTELIEIISGASAADSMASKK